MTSNPLSERLRDAVVYQHDNLSELALDAADRIDQLVTERKRMETLLELLEQKVTDLQSGVAL